MLGLKENMFWKCFFVCLNLVVGIYCENWWNNDESYQVMLKNQKFNSHRRHSSRNDSEIWLKHSQVLSDEPLNLDAEPIPFDAANRKNVHQNFRRRKMGSSHKKSIFRRGQRHRHNKNGNSFFKTTNQCWLLFFFPFAHYTINAITNRFNLREMSFCPCLWHYRFG